MSCTPTLTFPIALSSPLPISVRDVIVITGMHTVATAVLELLFVYLVPRQTPRHSTNVGFYRAMHFSAKRGIAIACRLSACLSVRPSVTLVDQDHIGRKSWKLIARTLSPTPSLFVAQRPSTYSQGNMDKFWGD